MSLLSHAPRFDTGAAEGLAREEFGIEATATPLPSERDQNFLLTTPTGDRAVLKIANALEDYGFLEAQNQALRLVSQREGLAPRLITTTAGGVMTWIDDADRSRHYVRVLEYLDGVPLVDVKHRPVSLLRDLGRAVARVDRALGELNHPAIHRDFHWDLAGGRDLCARDVSDIADRSLRMTIHRVMEQFDASTSAVLGRLPRSTIHNDANDHNVIVSRPAGPQRERGIVGLIDFGDIVHSYTVGGLAVAIAYAMLDSRDPLATAAEITAGYHSVRPLNDDELAALFGLSELRLCMSACVAADQTRERPDDEYLTVSQRPIRQTLPLLADIHPRLAEYTLRAACGLEPAPQSRGVRQWIEEHGGTAAPVLGRDLRNTPTTVVDLSVESPLVAGDSKENVEPDLTSRIVAFMRGEGAEIGIGRYGEARLLYSSPLFATATGRQRTIHLGVDLFAPAGTPVFAVLDGILHSAANNRQPLDYGPVVVLEHQVDDGLTFYTLYGHLAESSLSFFRVGDRVRKGDPIGTLGSADVNGGWTPHLHFQVLTDLLDRGADVPGVAPADSRQVWESIAPDPSPLVGVRADAGTFAEDAKSLRARRRAKFAPNLATSYGEPLWAARGWMQYLYDHDGRRYLDAYNNVPHVGHSHPDVVRAVADQLRVLNTNTRYLHETMVEFAERLTSTLPPALQVCLFVNSGSEANEVALRLARAHTGARDVIVFETAYHGMTSTLVDISPHKHAGPGGAGAPPWVHVVPLPDTFRGPYRSDDTSAGEKYAQFVADACDRLKVHGDRVAAFVAESGPSIGGQLVFPAGYLAAAYDEVKKAGGVTIADEVQTAYGRLGTHFWGFQAHDVVPDIVVAGKPIGNGFPIGAVITTPEIAASFDNGMEFFSTFGGSTVSCAAGLATLDVVLRDRLQEHARRVGDHLLAKLQRLAAQHEIIGDVRGSGLMVGIELVRDRTTLEPASDEATYVVNRLKDEGILIGTDGQWNSVLKIRPPMPFDAANADELADKLDRVLSEL